jgi:hypothetical protein
LEDKADTLWPRYAQDEFDANAGPVREAAEGWGGVVRQWDGSGTLLFGSVSILAHDGAPLPAVPDLLFGIDVPTNYRRDATAGNLWLPPISSGVYDVARNIVPQTFDAYAIPRSPPETYADPSAGANYKYLIKKDEFKNGGMMDFIYRIRSSNFAPLSPALYAVRIDGASGAWYDAMRPFTFMLRDIARQRGGVTVLKNVINPLRGDKTSLNYVLTQGGAVNVTVFTLDGKIVKTLYRGHREAGEHYETWDGRNGSGAAAARGIYFIRVVAPDIDEIRKVIVVK